MTSLKLRKFRVDLIRSLPWKERKEIRWLSPEMEAQRTQVMNALGQRHELYERMSECGSDDAWGGMKLCGVPLCPRCFMRRRGRETGQALKKSFVGIPNEQLAFLTLLLPVQTNLDKVEATQLKARNSLRNIIAYQRKRDARWNSVQLTGWWEMERLTASDIDKQGRNTRIALEALNFPVLARAGTTVWRPHLHAIVALGDITREEFAQALRSKGYDKPYQVDVQSFHTNRPVHANIKSVVRYSLKFRIEQDQSAADGLAYDKAADERADRNWWSDKDIVAYANWLMRGRSGFESLRVVISPKKKALSVCSVSGSDHLIDLHGINIHDISVHDTNWLGSEAACSSDSVVKIDCDVPDASPAVGTYDDDVLANEDSGSVLTTGHPLVPETQNKTLEFQLPKCAIFVEECQYASAALSPGVAWMPVASEMPLSDVARSLPGGANTGSLRPPAK